MNKKIILIIVFILVIGGLAYFDMSFLWSSVKETQAEITQKQQKIKSLENIISRTETLKKDYQQLQSKKEKLYNTIPESKNTSQLLAQLEKLVLNNGLLFKGVSFDASYRTTAQAPPKNQNKKIRSFNFQLEITGSYDAFKNFIKSLEQNTRIMDVRSFSLQGRASFQGNLGSESLTATIVAETYYERD